MRISLIIFLFTLSGCKHFGLIFKPPATLKAVIEGNVKGIDIRCEKVLDLGKIKWELMCKVSDEIDIKYRTLNFDDGITKLEIKVDRETPEKKKTLAWRMLMVKNNKPAVIETTNMKGSLVIKAEHMR